MDVTLWGRTAEIAGEYLAKGRQVLIEGRLKLDQWDDKTTGQKRSRLTVVGENMTMLGSRQDGGGGGRSSSSPPSQAGEGESGGNYYNQEIGEPPGGFEPTSAPTGGDVPF